MEFRGGNLNANCRPFLSPSLHTKFDYHARLQNWEIITAVIIIYIALFYPGCPKCMVSLRNHIALIVMSAYIKTSWLCHASENFSLSYIASNKKTRNVHQVCRRLRGIADTKGDAFRMQSKLDKMKWTQSSKMKLNRENIWPSFQVQKIIL